MNTIHTFSNINVTWRWRLLMIALGLLMLASYQISIKKAFHTIAEYRNLKLQSAGFSDTQNDSAENFIVDIKKIKRNEHLLSMLTASCDTNGVEIKEVSQSYSISKDSLKIETNRIVLQGSYQQLLNFVADVEQKECAINSIRFEIVKDKLSNAYSLLSTLYIKTVIL